MKKRYIIALFAAILSAATLCAQPKVVGHRGCRFDGPFENTLASLRLAQDVKVDAVEFDVHLTSDDHVIVYHGPAVPGTDIKDIRTVTFAGARALTLPGGHGIPTLEEWFAEASKHPEITLVMEIKKQLTPEKELLLVRKAMEIASKAGVNAFLEYTSFSERALDEVLRLRPDAKAIYLASGVHVPTASWAMERGYKGISYNLDGFLNRPEIADEAGELGIETTLWLVNDFEVADWAVRHGIDYISSDHPELLVPYMEAVRAYRAGKGTKAKLLIIK